MIVKFPVTAVRILRDCLGEMPYCDILDYAKHMYSGRAAHETAKLMRAKGYTRACVDALYVKTQEERAQDWL